MSPVASLALVVMMSGGGGETATTRSVHHAALESVQGVPKRKEHPTAGRDVFSDADPAVAPERPAPWVKSPFIHLFQVVAGVGARTAVAPLLMVPVAGPVLAVVAMPLAEAAAITWTGDRLGDGRGALVWPLLSSAVVGGASIALLVLGLSAMMGAVALNLGYSGVQVALPGAAVSSPLVSFSLLLAVGVPLVLVSWVALAASQLLAMASPIVSTLVYQFTKRRKSESDNGSDGISFLPRAAEPPGAPAQPAPTSPAPAAEHAPASAPVEVPAGEPAPATPLPPTAEEPAPATPEAP